MKKQNLIEIRISKNLLQKDLTYLLIKLLTLAGKCNTNGFIFLTEDTPYRKELLIHKLIPSHNAVKLTLRTFKELGMIQFNEELFLKLSN